MDDQDNNSMPLNTSPPNVDSKPKSNKTKPMSKEDQDMEECIMSIIGIMDLQKKTGKKYEIFDGELIEVDDGSDTYKI